jgi:hypothetical protein
MKHMVVAVVVVTLAPAAFAQHFTKQMSRATTELTYEALTMADDALVVSFSSHSADGEGTITLDGDVDAARLRCLARQHDELVRATADPTALDALLELAHGQLRIGLVDIRSLGFDPIRGDHRFDYGLSVDNDAVVLTALLHRDGCTQVTATQIAGALVELRAIARTAKPEAFTTSRQTLLSRIRARAKVTPTADRR